MTSTLDELPDTEREFIRRRLALVFQLRQHLTGYAFGETLPTASALAVALDVETRFISPALTHLDAEGALVYRGGNRAPGRSYRLRPGEQHPDDVAFDRDVRQKIASGHYRPGTPLPTQILADRHGLAPSKLPRASRWLIKDRLIAHREEGPLGPGLYVACQERPEGEALPA
ncbi:hypothetical protein ACFVFF_07600 [Streptomyces sp. NPDC057680]|uniref:hypothetical protein n=1 Tax=Streptomyces sp. NPDC057680 TaxID=3346208 RepID=UPI00369C3DCA